MYQLTPAHPITPSVVPSPSPFLPHPDLSMGPAPVVPGYGGSPGKIFEIIFYYSLVLAHFPSDMGAVSPHLAH